MQVAIFTVLVLIIGAVATKIKDRLKKSIESNTVKKKKLIQGLNGNI